MTWHVLKYFFTVHEYGLKPYSSELQITCWGILKSCRVSSIMCLWCGKSESRELLVNLLTKSCECRVLLCLLFLDESPETCCCLQPKWRAYTSLSAAPATELIDSPLPTSPHFEPQFTPPRTLKRRDTVQQQFFRSVRPYRGDAASVHIRKPRKLPSGPPINYRLSAT